MFFRGTAGKRHHTSEETLLGGGYRDHATLVSMG